MPADRRAYRKMPNGLWVQLRTALREPNITQVRGERNRVDGRFIILAFLDDDAVGQWLVLSVCWEHDRLTGYHGPTVFDAYRDAMRHWTGLRNGTRRAEDYFGSLTVVYSVSLQS